MLLKRLEIRNCRKIRQADIEFYGPGLYVILGMNESGKSTLVQCIAISLEGPKSIIPGMITHGEEQAEILAYIEGEQELKIRTVITDSVKQTVSKKDDTSGKYGALSGGVRGFLDSIRSGLEMPWALRDMTDARIIEVLKDRAGITQRIAEIDAAIKDKEAARTETGRDKKRLGTKDPVKSVDAPPPIDDIRAERDKAVHYIKSVYDEFVRVSDEIRQKCNFNTVADMRTVTAEIEKNAQRIEIQLEKHKPYTQKDVATLENQIADWVEEDKKAKEYQDYLAWKKEFDELAAQYETLTGEIETLRGDRKKTLAAMNLGVKGLVIGEDNLLYHNGAVRGITETNRVGNWSTAESVKVFFTIGAAFSGALKVMVVDNAESLDPKTTKAISDWAEAAEFLVILLKVATVPDELEEGIIYIREGEVLKK